MEKFERIFKARFFATLEAARAFRKQNGGGALSSWAPGSRTREEYCEAMLIACKRLKALEGLPYAVVWVE